LPTHAHARAATVMEVRDHPSEFMIERAMGPLAQIVRGAAVDAPASACEAGTTPRARDGGAAEGCCSTWHASGRCAAKASVRGPKARPYP
jgi:hypothetical protein